MPSEVPDFALLLNPQDHTRLKTSWLEMLHHRFLSPKLVSVLPFYLSSSDFKDIKTLPTLHIPLPSNSDTANSHMPHWFDNDFDGDSGIGLEFRAQVSRLSTESRPADTASITSRRSQSTFSSAWASMHLARTVNLIEGCKAAIYDEFQKLGSSHNQGQVVDGGLDRAEFESVWANWLK